MAKNAMRHEMACGGYVDATRCFFAAAAANRHVAARSVESGDGAPYGVIFTPLYRENIFASATNAIALALTASVAPSGARR